MFGRRPSKSAPLALVDETHRNAAQAKLNIRAVRARAFVHRSNLWRKRFIFATQDSVTANEDGHLLAFVQSKCRILFLGHARADDEAGRKFDLHAHENPEKERVANDPGIPVLRGIGRYLDGEQWNVWGG